MLCSEVYYVPQRDALQLIIIQFQPQLARVCDGEVREPYIGRLRRRTSRKAAREIGGRGALELSEELKATDAHELTVGTAWMVKRILIGPSRWPCIAMSHLLSPFLERRL